MESDQGHMSGGRNGFGQVERLQRVHTCFSLFTQRPQSIWSTVIRNISRCTDSSSRINNHMLSWLYCLSQNLKKHSIVTSIQQLFNQSINHWIIQKDLRLGVKCVMDGRMDDAEMQRHKKPHDTFLGRILLDRVLGIFLGVPYHRQTPPVSVALPAALLAPLAPLSPRVSDFAGRKLNPAAYARRVSWVQSAEP